MYILLLGPSKSGKSRLAERIAHGLGAERLLYVATMIPVGEGEEGDARVARHRAQREGLGFVTIECPANLAEVRAEKSDAVLLEDVSNLLANNMFSADRPHGMEDVLADMDALAGKCSDFVVVSFTGVEKSPDYDEATNAYVDALAAINDRLRDRAGTVIEVESGVASLRKGELPTGCTIETEN